ncbi:MAG: hypothetical protein AAGC93_03110 [Cyanobacteria bacterium P01_F01_bin.53]
MTVITAVKKGDEIAIACDTQTSKGNFRIKYLSDFKVNDSKLLTYGESTLGFSGTVAIHQIFEDLFATTTPAPFTTRQEIFQWMLSQHDTLKNHYYLKTDAGNNKNQVTETNWISALVANPHGIFGIGAYREVTEYSKFWAVGSGANFALGAMDILYEQPLSASEIAEAAALTATKFDPACAPPIYVKTIQPAKKAKRQKTGQKASQKTGQKAGQKTRKRASKKTAS